MKKDSIHCVLILLCKYKYNLPILCTKKVLKLNFTPYIFVKIEANWELSFEFVELECMGITKSSLAPDFLIAHTHDVCVS